MKKILLINTLFVIMFCIGIFTNSTYATDDLIDLSDFENIDINISKFDFSLSQDILNNYEYKSDFEEYINDLQDQIDINKINENMHNIKDNLDEKFDGFENYEKISKKIEECQTEKFKIINATWQKFLDDDNEAIEYPTFSDISNTSFANISTTSNNMNSSTFISKANSIKQKSSSPATGDMNILLWLIVLVISFTGMITSILFLRKLSINLKNKI